MLFNSVRKLLEKEGYWCRTIADAGSLNGACIYLDIENDISVGIWQHTKSTVGIRFNASQYYATCSNANQVLAIIQIVKDIKKKKED